LSSFILRAAPFPLAQLNIYYGVLDKESTNIQTILGVLISEDLKRTTHVEYIGKKANKRLYALRTLKKAGVPQLDIAKVNCSLIRSTLEYAVPASTCIPREPY
jgi:hypothetical protein